jgi:hypothetical protein
MKVKRPLLAVDDRGRLRHLADNARRHTDIDGGGSNRAYAQGVIDVLEWMANNAEPTPMLEDILR